MMRIATEERTKPGSRRLMRHGAVLAAIVLMAPVATAASAEDAKDMLLGTGILDIVEKGGVVMIIILAGSIVGLACAFERFVALRKGVLLPKGFIDAVREGISRKDMAAIEKAVEGRRGPLPRILAAGLERRSDGEEDMDRAMEVVGAREVARLKRPVKPLSVLATVEPLLGLLGTIFGMISTFNILHTTSAAERVEKLAPGIGQALYTTAAGLCIAIPFVVLYHWLNGRVNRAAEEWSLVATDMVYATNGDESASASKSEES